ncbi:hypothetical protein Tco_0701991 [Tanacetum coccineum]|uniref:Uncharacterized protein n=1 Tax=Tanacetum coccineum TaxID=301880 RepID=A0ABQ4XUP6_9ASTR
MVKPVWNNAQRVNHHNFAKKTHLCAKNNMVPRIVLMESGLVSVNTIRQVNTAHSKTTVNVARPMPMTGNMSYLTDYEEIDGGYVAFGGNPKRGKISGKGGGSLGAQKPIGILIAQTRVESSDNKESLGEDASKQGRIDAIDAYEEITLVSVHDVNVSAGEEVFATTVDDITLAQVLEEMKSIKPKNKGVVIQELDLIRLDEETALNLQAEFNEEERLAREKAEKEEEANIAMIET